MSTLVIHFARFGPYHLARISAAAKQLSDQGWEVVGLETSGADETYAWRPESGPQPWQRITVFPGESVERIPAGQLKSAMMRALDGLTPAVVVVAGWGSVDARAALSWCRKNRAKAIVMSETREADGQRVWWKEALKSRLIRQFDAALVGGASQRDYLVKLGMKKERIRLGYNVVDDGYFAAEAEKWRDRLSVVSCQLSDPVPAPFSSTIPDPRPRSPIQWRPYFLASNRFIERKNLARLVEAYSSYAHPSTINDQQSTVWNLCLLGDGELKEGLIAQCHRLGLTVAECAPWEIQPTTDNRQPATVYFPGFRQIEELPRFFAHAACFIHPALEEPWGLVINEAMACGLPILSSKNVGAAEELLEHNVNGFTFDAIDEGQILECLNRVSGASEIDRDAMGAASVRILREKCPTEAFGRGLAALLSGK